MAFPSSHQVLTEISLHTSSQVTKFIASIENNPNKSYLNAVKNISVHNVDNDDTKLDHDIIEKLFFRFKNVKSIYFSNSSSLFKDFNDCEKLIMACPRLESCTLGIYPWGRNDRAKYYEIAWKLRQLLTKVDIQNEELLEQYGGALQSISGIYRLKWITIWCNTIENFEKLLPAFEHLANLKTIDLESKEDSENFAEKYLSTKPKDIQDLIMQRLSRVERIKIIEQEGFPTNLIKFIKKYMKGLNTFIMSGIYYDDHWTELEQEAIHGTLIDIICSTKKCARVTLMVTDISDVSTCLPIIARKLFYQDVTTSSTRRILQFKLEEDWEGLLDENTKMTVKRDSSERKIAITLSTEFSIHDFSSKILDQTTAINGVDEFILVIENRDSTEYNTGMVTTDSYDAILDKLPFLKQVTISVPSLYKEIDPTSTSIYSTVEEATIRSIPDICIQKLLNRYSFAFPNMKRLNLHYFSGTWNEDIGEYRVDLSSCNLEKLEVDVTPITNKTFGFMQEKFFIIVVDTGKHHLYKVPIVLSSISSVEENDLDGLTLGKDYVQLYITVAGLRRLEVCGIVDPEDDQYYYYDEEPDKDDDCYLDTSNNFKKCGITLVMNEDLLQ